MASIDVFVNEDVTGDHVAMVMRGCGFLEDGEELLPLIELTPDQARAMAEVLIECAGKIDQ